MKQPHGGALRRGGKKGNAGGSGRPSNELRDRYLSTVSELGPSVVADIASGKPVQRPRLRVLDLFPYVECANCGEKELKPKNVDAMLAEIEVEISASPRDRIAALEHASKYGLGPLKEITVQNVRERLNQSLDVIQSHTSAEQNAAIVKALMPIWE